MWWSASSVVGGVGWLGVVSVFEPTSICKHLPIVTVTYRPYLHYSYLGIATWAPFVLL
jgi:hypothetical protein